MLSGTLKDFTRHPQNVCREHPDVARDPASRKYVLPPSRVSQNVPQCVNACHASEGCESSGASPHRRFRGTRASRSTIGLSSSSRIAAKRTKQRWTRGSHFRFRIKPERRKPSGVVRIPSFVTGQLALFRCKLRAGFSWHSDCDTVLRTLNSQRTSHLCDSSRDPRCTGLL